jgi:hypothetical protein
LKRIALGMTVVNLIGLAIGGCGRSGETKLPPAEELDAALRPAALVAAMKRLRGAHFAGAAMFRVRPAEDARKPEAAARDAITTNTELWLDRHGQFRLVESNDHDGGREVVLYGRELSVAIKPGKMVRRSALEPEPTRMMEEAVGGPWAAWETVRRFATVEPGGSPGSYRLSRSAAPVPVAASFAEATTLRRWRDTVQVEAMEGEATVDPKSGVLLGFKLRARFTATREDKVPLTGEIAVTTRLDKIGGTPLVQAPPAEPLQQRQRTILEERALLGDLGRPASKEGR